jgi:hypothetical protein
MLKFFSRNKKENQVEATNCNVSKYDGSVYYGIFECGDIVVEGAYVRDGVRTFCTVDGVGNLPKGVKLRQLERKEMPEIVHYYVDCVKNGYCTPLVSFN